MIDSLSRVIIKGFLDKVCIPIKAKSFQEAIRLAKKARKRGVKYLEIWLDQLPGDSVFELQRVIVRSDDTKIIAVCKTPKEKGSFRGTEESRLNILISAATSGADFIDVDIDTKPWILRKALSRIRTSDTKIILSYHNFKKTPSIETLLRICKRGFKLGANIMKIATEIKKFSDNITLFELVSRMKDQGKEVIVVGMGKNGILGRIGCLVLGGFLTYVALDKERKTAAGQLVLRNFRNRT